MMDNYTIQEPNCEKRKMTDIEIILALIETVKPDDTAMLDEIDARVWCWRGLLPFVKVYRCDETFKMRLVCMDRLADGSNKECSFPVLSLVTRSRNAIKQMRPDGYYPQMTYSFFTKRWICEVWNIDHNIVSKYANPIEELAELHATLQAIQHERENK